MKALLAIALCCFWLPWLSAQETTANPEFEARLSGEVFDTPQGYNGDQYFQKDWANGNVLLESGQQVKNKSLKYNGFLDQLIWFDPERQRMVKLDKAFIREFTLESKGGNELLFRRINIPGLIPADTLEVFAEVLVEGRLKLYVQRRIVVKGSSTLELGDRQYLYDDLFPHNRYILVLSDQRKITFNRIKKQIILNQLPAEFRAPFQSALKQLRWRLRNERQLAEVVKSMDQTKD